MHCVFSLTLQVLLSSLPETAVCLTPMGADDDRAICMRSLIDGKFLTPHLLYGSPEEVTIDRCAQSAVFDGHANISLLLDTRSVPALMKEAFERVTSSERIGSRCLDDVWEILPRDVDLAYHYQFTIGICAPAPCLQKSPLLPIVIYLVLLMQDSGLGNLRLEDVIMGPPYYVCAFASDLDHVFVKNEEMASHVQKGLDSLLDLDWQHAEAQAALARMQRSQARLEEWQALVEEHDLLLGGKSVGLSPTEYNDRFAKAYLWQAHQHNERMSFKVQPPPPEISDAFFLTERNLDLQRRLLVAAAEMGVESAVYQAATNAFSTGWPVAASSSATPFFGKDSVQDLPIFRLQEVCVRDLTRETEWLDRGVSSISSGRRLELLTLQIPDAHMDMLNSRPHSNRGRFVMTSLSTTQELAERLRGFQVTRFTGLSFFWYTGHKDSTNCPDCSHVEHALLDDMLLDLLIAYINPSLEDSSVEQIVTNLHSSVGLQSHRKWIEQVLSRLAGDLMVSMRPSEVFCFQDVLMNFLYSVTEHPHSELLFEDGALHPGYEITRALAWARQRLWDSVDSEFHSTQKYVIYPRHDSDNLRGRRWIGYEALAEKLGAKVITFKRLGFEEEVSLMRSIGAILTITGGHHAAALFMKPGSLWIELVCPWYLELIPGHRAFQGLARALGLQFVPISPNDCPDIGLGMSPDAGEVWLPADMHPVFTFGELLGRENVVMQNEMCSYAFETVAGVDPAFAQGGRIRGQMWDGVLEKVNNQEDALTRCTEWGTECQSAVPTEEHLWLLMRVPAAGAAWHKKSCAERNGLTGQAMLHDRSAIPSKHAETASVHAPSNLEDLISNLITK
mmetsp:Transcript_69645/g.115345  ORF Transcript_69645/g.115345 Transcript_69645/m.115345 type:complete len:845 (+) Transcript_69645:60-2594(+)